MKDQTCGACVYYDAVANAAKIGSREGLCRHGPPTLCMLMAVNHLRQPVVQGATQYPKVLSGDIGCGQYKAKLIMETHEN